MFSPFCVHLLNLFIYYFIFLFNLPILICDIKSPPPDEPAVDEDDLTNEDFWKLANGEVSFRYTNN